MHAAMIKRLAFKTGAFNAPTKAKRRRRNCIYADDFPRWLVNQPPLFEPEIIADFRHQSEFIKEIISPGMWGVVVESTGITQFHSPYLKQLVCVSLKPNIDYDRFKIPHPDLVADWKRR